MINMVKKYWWIIIIMIVFFLFLEIRNVDAIVESSGFVHDDIYYTATTLPDYDVIGPNGYRFWYQGLPPIGQITSRSGNCSGTWRNCYYNTLPHDFDVSDEYPYSYWLGSGYYYIVWWTTLAGEQTNVAYHKFYSIDEQHFILLEEGQIWASDPASGTIITNPESSFTFNWAGIDPYNLLGIGFNNRLTGISSDYIYYEIDSLIGSSTTINLNTFGIDRNGNWYFQGFLTALTPETYEDVFFTGRYTSISTNDLAEDQNYYLTFSVLGFETIFVMETFEDWYAINSTRYDSPTNMFIAITGVIGPIFNRIGEFGQRIEDYFNLDEAYSSGFGIGRNIPIFGYYLAQISFFIGNFPFIKWVFIILLFFVGVFIFRLVLKFIPFLGGS